MIYLIVLMLLAIFFFFKRYFTQHAQIDAFGVTDMFSRSRKEYKDIFTCGRNNYERPRFKIHGKIKG